VTSSSEPLTMQVAAAAEMWGISVGLAYKLARSGELPGCHRLGRRFVVSRAQTLEALHSSEKGERNGPP
jgi:hypothetical protein